MLLTTWRTLYFTFPNGNFQNFRLAKKRLAPCCERSNHFIEDMNFETIKCQVSFFDGRLTYFLGLFGPTLPTVKFLFFIGISVQVYRRWKVWWFRQLLLSLVSLAVNTNGKGYVIWSLPLNNLWHPAQPHASSRSPEAISGNPLCKQELVLQEEIVGVG